MSIVYLTKQEYANCETWQEFYEEKKSLLDVPYDGSWHLMFSMLKKNDKSKEIDEKIKGCLKKLPQSGKIYPFPSYCMKAFTITPADEVDVVFIGQDPYFNCEWSGKKHVPQAMGLSFSVPSGVKVPSSLENIYKNMVKYGHLKTIPKSGNLWYWAAQGCLMLNTALTVEDGAKKSHTKIWQWYTDQIISYISKYMNGIIFVLWGGDAYEKITLIDLDKHHTIISSHPSGLSVAKPFRKYPAFANLDHFGEINKLLEAQGKRAIRWD